MADNSRKLGGPVPDNSLTSEQVRDYIAGKGLHCPYCGSADLDGGHLDADGPTAVGDVTCLTCDRAWKDVYSLSAVLTMTDLGDAMALVGPGALLVKPSASLDEDAALDDVAAFLLAQRLANAASAHGEDSDETEHAIGDLEGFLMAALRLFTPGQFAAFLAAETVKGIVTVITAYEDLAAEFYPPTEEKPDA